MLSKETVIGILAHVDAGKTTLTEAILYKTGVIRKIGRVDKKDSFFDSHYLERNRGITIFSKQTPFTVNNTDFTLIDTPGHVDFSAEMERSLSVLDYAILVIDANAGIQSHTETIWQLLGEYNIPTFIFINKTDYEGFDKYELVRDIKDRLHENCIDFTQPKNDFNEEISMTNEALLEAFLDSDLNNESIDKLISRAICERTLFPCYFGSALFNKGIDELLCGIEKYTEYKAYPDEFSATVYKIAHDNQGNRLSFLKITGGRLRTKEAVGDEKIDTIRIIQGEKQQSVNEITAGSVCAVSGLYEVQAGARLNKNGIVTASVFNLSPLLSAQVIICDKTDIHTAYKKLSEIDDELPELSVRISHFNNEEQLHIRVMGRIQLDILKSVVRDRFNMDISFGPCRILYKETIKEPVSGYGHYEPLRHYAEVHLRLEPSHRGSGITTGNECSNESPEMSIQHLILTHINEKEHIGILTGSPLTDVKIILTAGRNHLKHTSGGDFREATYRAVRQALEKAENILLEPYYSFVLRIPAEHTGRAISDIGKLYGEFEAPQISQSYATIKGFAPVSELMNYPEELIAYTSGKGSIVMREKGYMPCHNTEEVIKAIGYEKDRDMSNPSSSIFCSHGAGFEVKWYDVDNMRHIK